MKETVDFKTAIIALGEAPVTTIADTLDIHRVTLSRILKTMKISQYRERMKGTVRLITLTSEGVNTLLWEVEKHKSQWIKNTPEQSSEAILSSEQKEEEIEGIFYDEFKKIFSSQTKASSSRTTWQYLTKNHFSFFNHRKNPNSSTSDTAYQLKTEYIEQALQIALRFVESKNADIKEKQSKNKRL